MFVAEFFAGSQTTIKTEGSIHVKVQVCVCVCTSLCQNSTLKHHHAIFRSADYKLAIVEFIRRYIIEAQSYIRKLTSIQCILSSSFPCLIIPKAKTCQLKLIRDGGFSNHVTSCANIVIYSFFFLQFFFLLTM